MPASVADLTQAVKTAINEGTRLLSDQIISSSKKALLHQVDFKASENVSMQELNCNKIRNALPNKLSGSHMLDGCKSKYIPLNETARISDQGSGSSENDMNNPQKKDSKDCLPKPKVMLYPKEKVRLEWRRVQKIGSGLVNMGNTCFLNSTLQCLTYTPPLVNYCLSDEHKKTCNQTGFCMLCELQHHIRRCFGNHGHAIKPYPILHKLKMIAKHMHWGSQEDAHEFLRYVVDALQKACLNGHSALDKYSRETTVINHIFGGFLRSQVLCLQCGETSNTFDPFMDLSLDIQNMKTLERALEKFVQPETLEKDNAYLCLSCKRKVSAQKRLSVHKPPNIMTIQLKRFDYEHNMGKIRQYIRFPDKLNLRPYLSKKKGEPVFYRLYAVLVHSGDCCNSGHYYCYVKSPTSIWYCMNDSSVSPVSVNHVFDAQAYVLFYSRVAPKKPNTGPTVQGAQNQNSPQKLEYSNYSNGIGAPSTEVGSPVSRKRNVLGSWSDSILPDKRVKVSFGLNSVKNKTNNGLADRSSGSGDRNNSPAYKGNGLSDRSSSSGDKSNSSSDKKPRIVVHIKNGKVTTFEKSPDGYAKVMDKKDRLVNGDVKQSVSRLVPYGDDSDSDQEPLAKKVKANGVHSQKKSESGNQKTENGPDKRVVFDTKLNATTSVPGNSSLLETPNNATKDFVLGKTNKTHTLVSKTDANIVSCSTKSGQNSIWHVEDQELEPSPSIGSCSSTTSVNSTTEWLVTHDQERESCSRRGNNGASSTSQSRERKYISTDSNYLEAEKEGSILKQNDISFKDDGGENNETQLLTENILQESTVIQKPSSKIQLATHQTILSNVSEENICDKADIGRNDETVCEVKMKLPFNQDGLNGHSLLNKNSKENGDSYLSEHSNKNETVGCLAKLKLPFHKEGSKKTHSSSDKMTETVAAISNGNHISCSDKQPLLLESPLEDHLSKKVKKHKRHKKNKHKYKELINENSELDTSLKKHKKKKKKHKHKKEKEKHAHHSDSDEQSEKKQDDSSSLDYIWVEKTKETIVSSSNTVASAKQIAEQTWDYYSNSRNGGPKPVGTIWDGSKFSKVAAELEKNSSIKGYGSSVPSWEGGASHLDQEVEKEVQSSRKKQREDDYDEELDAGRIKKVRKHSLETNFNHNPFQQMLDERTSGKSHSTPDHFSGGHQHSSQRNGHHGSHASSFHSNHASSYHSSHSSSNHFSHRSSNSSHHSYSGSSHPGNWKRYQTKGGHNHKHYPSSYGHQHRYSH